MNGRPPESTQRSACFFHCQEVMGPLPTSHVLRLFLEMGPGHPKPSGVSVSPFTELSAGDRCWGYAPTSRQFGRRREAPGGAQGAGGEHEAQAGGSKAAIWVPPGTTCLPTSTPQNLTLSLWGLQGQ